MSYWILTMILNISAYITQHDKTPVASAQMANFQSVQELGAEAIGMETLVVVHGE